MTSPQDLYQELLTIVRRAALLESSAAVLGWDRETYMPANGAEHRANQMSLLSGLHHQAATDERIGELLDTLNETDLNEPATADSAVNQREIRRRYDRNRRLPQDLVEETARVTALAQHYWSQARQADDYQLFSPWLKNIIRLKQEEAAAVGFAADGTSYDALLDEYEPQSTSREIADVFGRLRSKLIPLLDRIRGCPRSPDASILVRDYPVAQQKKFGQLAAKFIGFDFDSGRLDVTAHPFCSRIGPGDCRLTTRYDANFFSGAFFGTLHEAGHGLYEQGLSSEAWGTPLGHSVSLGIHESQSRLWENIVGRSRAFWQYFFSQAQTFFPDALKNTSLDEFFFAVNTVRPSPIRVEADEVTYNLHIMLRFDIERDLISGDLSVEDLPAAWNDRFKSDFGITPDSDADGCMQDIHWSAGLFGYFPTYALGNMYASQFYQTARDQLGDLDKQFSNGEFGTLLEWLRENIHEQGQRLPAGELVESVTGHPLSDAPLIRHLTERFLPLYQGT
ncbi:MAG: carboxypeptidase M32 [Fuerstiella sp.]|nr:carboxypeptidase M32 [Fuerstiella sp.]